MELLIGYIEQGLSFIIPLIILLGLLIFVHEMGHFLVAKFYGVKVEVFSLGFWKKIFSFRRGDTDYCLSLIPFGGYVKMFGDDPTAEIDESEKSGSFLHKPVGQRIAIVLAGPLMNFFFAILLFFVISMAGEEKLRPVVGDVKSGTLAYEAGFRPGDEILTVNGKAVALWDEVKEAIEALKKETVEFTVKRLGTDTTERFSAQTKVVENPNILSTEGEVGEITGLDFNAMASRVGVVYDSPAYKAGMRPLDIITSLNGNRVDRWYELVEQFQDMKETSEVEFTVERGEKQEKHSFKVPYSGSKELASIGLESSELYIAGAKKGTPAAKSKVKEGDKIVGINGNAIKKWEDLSNIVRNYKEEMGPLELTIVREGMEENLRITPESISQTSKTGGKENIYALGVFSGLLGANPFTTTVRITNPFSALVKGFNDSILWTKVTILSFVRLVQNKVSARSLGGPIMIGQLASKTFQIGLSPFLKIMAIISINLFILNLLPVPVLDGGHLVFFSIEALRGAPLSMRKMEIAQQVGLVLLLGLMALALFNDVTRLFE